MSETPQSASQAFFSGCKSGLNLALYGILPRVMVAFIFISVLEACGAMSLIGDIFTPLMHVWSLPGEAAVVARDRYRSHCVMEILKCIKLGWRSHPDLKS